MKAYPIKIGNSEYMVSGFGDRLGTPPSARGFNLKAFSVGLKKYETVFQATEENGYAFIIYADGDKKLIIKGGQGSDHKETVLAGSKELQDIRKQKYADQDDMTFLRKTCLSGRAWLVNVQNKNYYFVGIWNTTITSPQYDALKEYLTKFPSNATYIQMGMAGTGASSQFQLVSSFSPKIADVAKVAPKLSDKEKEFVRTAHMKKIQLPAAYAKQLQKLQSMTEDAALDNYRAYQTYKSYAIKLIAKLEKIKSLGKSKTPVKDIVTQSSATSVMMGLGKQFPQLTAKLNSLLPYTFTHSDLSKLHQKGKLDMTNWRDTSFDGVAESTLAARAKWLKDMSSGLGDKNHPVNHHVKNHVGKLRVKFEENAEMAQSDVTKIIKYSEALQSMFDVNDNLEDWVKAKLNHACDYVATVRDYLKFYRDEKQAGTALDQINEKWSNSYKNSINCSNPKGFSQKAHCRARKLRQAGHHTKSKPVREIYKEVTDQLLKEFNSSMAMGALKQLNNDAKELQTLLQPSSELEDWVKAKLNLAGEYLDDVYHHLDHFGPQGRKLDEVKLAKELEEGWKDWVAAGALGLGALTGGDKLQAAPHKAAPAITQQTSTLDQSFVDYIKSVENAGKKGYNTAKKLWFPHKSFEGGSDTIGYGHKITGGEDYSHGITDAQADALLKKDLQKAQAQVNKELGGRQLSKRQMEMLVDFVFNMGTLSKFPKFTQAVLHNDVAGMKAQYKRHAGGKELKGRNNAFLQRFLTEYFGFNYAIG